MTDCPTCNGKGKRYVVDKFRFVWQDCKDCRGTGANLKDYIDRAQKAQEKEAKR